MRIPFLFVLAMLFALFALSANAAYVDATAPAAKQVSLLDTIDLGAAGPGQTITLIMERGSDGTRVGYNRVAWDRVIPVDVPPGWDVEGSPYYENPMKVKIKIAPDAPNAVYTLTLRAEDEGDLDGLGNLTFYATVMVTKDVINISVSPTHIQTGVGQPATYKITITNTGSASDPFEIKVRERDLPAWRFKKQVLVNYNSSRVVSYEVVLDEEGEKNFTLQVSSLSSPLIYQEVPLSITAKGDVLQDWKATTHGLMLFPILLEPLYAIMGFLGNLIG